MLREMKRPDVIAAWCAGRDARLAGEPITANPFSGEEAIWWADGWRSVTEAGMQ